MSSDAAIHKEASENPYYKLNAMKKIICRLCNAMCRDDANFLVHLQGKPHRTNLEKAERRRRHAALREQRSLIEQQQQQSASGAGGIGGSAGSSAQLSATTVLTPYGDPEYKVRVVPMPEVQMTKVWLEAHFPKAAEDTRPLHRWVHSYEQSQEPQQPGIVYLLLACQGYTTIALKFPSEFSRTNDRDAPDGKYECRWDAVGKVYKLFFMLG